MKHIFCARVLSFLLCAIVCAEEPCDCCVEYSEFYNEWDERYSGTFYDEDGGSVTEESGSGT